MSVLYSPSRTRTLAAAICLSFSLHGCASITQGRYQEIVIETTPPGASCKVGNWEGRPPAVIQLERGFSYAIACNLEGHRETRALLRKKGTAWAFGNLLVGGIVGLALDASSRSGYRVDSKASIIMKRIDSAEAPVGRMPGDLPDELRPALQELILKSQQHLGVPLQEMLARLPDGDRGAIYDFILWNEARQQLSPEQFLLYKWLSENRSDFRPYRL